MKGLSYLFFIFFLFPLNAQEESFQVVEGTYRGFYLSMTVEECIEELGQDGYFEAPDPNRPSLLRQSEEVLLDCPGRSYIERGWFQFQEDKLVVFTIQLNEEQIDYYAVFSQLSSKYGPPDSLTPEKSLWRNEELLVDLELTLDLQVKYRDQAFFDQLIADGKSRDSYEEVLRDRFLEDF